jgi:hypothetical protein
LTTDTIGGTTNHNSGDNGYVFACQITASASGSLSSVGQNIETIGVGGYIRTAIYSDNGSDAPSTLLVESSQEASINGWNDLTVTGVNIVTGTKYWLALQIDNQPHPYSTSGNLNNVTQAMGAFPASPSWVSGAGWGIRNMRMTYILSYSPKTRSSVPNTMMQMLNSKMLFG